MRGRPVIDDQLENPVLGYVVIAVAVVVGMLSATVFGQGPGQTTVAHPKTCVITDTVEIHEGDHRVADKSGATRPSTPVNRPGTFSPRDPRRRDETVRRWILGVRSTPTAAGCVVTAVLPGSAAERCGLAVGDRILTVGGQQVGLLGDRLIRLDQAIDSASSRQTCLLVQRGGSGMVQPLTPILQTLYECLGH
ncbi:PDZ domain-containing protein [Stieleria sp. ICT_E10.1]|uniref:PDZ domain-containing protein n=1 Tax=Stieleria sedimenti TaxID=2976331 RepID=UPI00217F527C|nr:PDZ domain-containing protein [Stieleria sedimenti]MCS7470268.1 PDZ domain-containing protein [Stieleria sedimenti]